MIALPCCMLAGYLAGLARWNAPPTFRQQAGGTSQAAGTVSDAPPTAVIRRIKSASGSSSTRLCNSASKEAKTLQASLDWTRTMADRFRSASTPSACHCAAAEEKSAMAPASAARALQTERGCAAHWARWTSGAATAAWQPDSGGALHALCTHMPALYANICGDNRPESLRFYEFSVPAQQKPHLPAAVGVGATNPLHNTSKR